MMPLPPRVRRWAASGIMLALGLGLPPAGSARAAVVGEEVQPLPAPSAPLPVGPLPAGARSAFSAKGTELCVRCHRSEQTAWVDASTTATWRHDAHSRAHLALGSDNPRTRGMEAVLGIKAAQTAACIACHTHPAGEPAVEEETPLVHAGISCETCHGAGSGYFEPHMEKRWRFLPSAEKEALGMHDLRNPAAKAANCLSCHLGDVDAGKVVTHAMYAAGHPPLPAFEMESFGKAMGPHWKRVWEKSPQIRQQAAEAGYRTEAASESQRSLIGGLVALKQSTKLVDAYAAAAGVSKERPWPELSLYDCQACHHELRVPSARQQAGYGGLVPGRPSLVRWPRGLAAVAFQEAGMPSDVDALLAPWVAALSARPFGDQQALPDAASSRDHLARIDQAITALATVPRSEADARAADRSRARIAALSAAGARCGELETARLLGWVMVAALREDPSWPEDRRAAAIGSLESSLALGFPSPAYPEPSSAQKPFWQTSLSAARDADMAAIRAAFRAVQAR
ncbi:MAG: multiheme c-type cytochrome [Planctomycetia bacterium]